MVPSFCSIGVKQHGHVVCSAFFLERIPEGTRCIWIPYVPRVSVGHAFAVGVDEGKRHRTLLAMNMQGMCRGGKGVGEPTW